MGLLIQLDVHFLLFCLILAAQHKFGSHPYICWLLKGVYERKTPKPRYTEFWDVDKGLVMFKEWGPNQHLERLLFKLVMLLLLVTSQRGQTVVNLDVQDMEFVEDKVIFKMKKLLKHNRVGDPLDTIVLQRYHECKRLCLITCLRAYLAKTQLVGGYSQLLLSYVRPFKSFQGIL